MGAVAAKLCGATVSIRGAGRTDAGVHAAGQVAHFDLPRRYPADTVRNALNFHLKPHPVAVLDCAEVGDDTVVVKLERVMVERLSPGQPWQFTQRPTRW